MIVKVCARVTNVRGIVSYLMGPGKKQEHTNQHTVSGTVQYPGPDSPDLRRQLTADLQMHSKLHPGVEIKGGPVYHVALSLSPQEQPLSDARWDRIATEFMDGMNMTGTGPKATMWTAVRHGLSADGNDHVHILANLIRQDGTKVSLHNDMIRASRVVADIEKRHGLQVVAGRGSGGNQVPYTGGEAARAAKEGHEIERVELERRIRAHAEASGSEAEFVRRVRASGIEVRPRRGAQGAVTGYSVSIPGTGVAFPGGKLAKDLTLPALRKRWADQHPATSEWIKGKAGQPVTKYGTETRMNMPSTEKVTAELDAFRKALGSATTQHEIRELSRQLSGALATGATLDPRLRRPARQAASWAPRYGSPNRFMFASVTMAMLVAAQGKGRGAAGDMIAAKLVVDALMELWKLHQMRVQAVHAATYNRGGVPMHTPTPDDGLDESLESIATTGTVAVAAAVQHLAQTGQDRLLAMAKQESNSVTDKHYTGAIEVATDCEKLPGVQVPEQVKASPVNSHPMSPKQQNTLEQIARRAGLDVSELQMDDLRYATDMSLSQAAKMIDGLGDPKYGSSGHARDQLRMTATMAAQTPAPSAAAGFDSTKYARAPQQPGPGVEKNVGVKPKF